MTQKVTTTHGSSSEEVFYDLIEKLVYGLGLENAELLIDDENPGHSGRMVTMEFFDTIPDDVYYDLVFGCANRGWEVHCWDLHEPDADGNYRFYDLSDAFEMAHNDLDTFERMFCPDEIIPTLRCSDCHKITITPDRFFCLDMRPYMGQVTYDIEERWEKSLREFEKEVS